MNKKGMTLLELMVYIGLAALLLAPVIMLMHNSSVNMARDAGRMGLYTSGRDVLGIMYDDLINTGFKIENQDIATGVFNISNAVLWSPTDSSSFNHIIGAVANFDTLQIRKGVLDPNAPPNSLWQGVSAITYGIRNNNELWRTETFEPATAGQNSELRLASGVEALKFQFSDSLMSEWRNTFTATSPNRKPDMRFIKVSIVMRDRVDRKMAATRTGGPITFTVRTGATTPDSLQTITVGTTTGGVGDQILRELNEIVIPIPNNGLFP